MHQFVGQRQQVEQTIQVADRRMDVYGFHRVSAGEVNAIEDLGQFEEILIILAVADPAATVQV